MKNWTKWIPAIAVPAVVIATGAIVVPLSANAAPDLPEKTPTEVLALLAGGSVDAFSGTVTVTNDLGLPDLSSLTSGSGSSSSDTNLDLLTGTHSARVYVDGATKARVQVLDKLAERDVVHNGSDVWLYSSDDNTVVHSTLPAKSTPAPATGADNPADVAKQAVAALEPTSDLAVTTAQTVAGRDAYTLVLSPKADGTLIGSVEIAVDSATGLPLSVSATAKGASAPAWSLAFSDLDLSTPAASLFDFSTPAGATVDEKALPSTGSGSVTKGDSPAPTVTGSGWASVVSLSLGADAKDLISSPQFAQLTTAVDGGRALSTALVNVLVTTDGTVLAGSVPVSTLQAAAK